VRIGVVVGLTAEARLARRLGWPVAIGGGTVVGAKAAAIALVEQGCTGLICFGLAGGLDPALRPGAVIVPSGVIAGDKCYATDPSLSHLLGGSVPDSVLSTDAIVATVEEKRRLRQQTGAVAVDMESGAVAWVGSMHGIPFAVLRAICDPANSTLPPAALAAVDARGAIRIWRLLASIVARPRQLPGVFALAADAAAARQALLGRIRLLARVAACELP
jgi:adenosylhomocysteine nucleosidase